MLAGLIAYGLTIVKSAANRTRVVDVAPSSYMTNLAHRRLRDLDGLAGQPFHALNRWCIQEIGQKPIIGLA